MVNSKHSFVGTIAWVMVAIAGGLTGLRVLADAQQSALPNVGATQTFKASQATTMAGISMPPNQGGTNQSGTLTVARLASDSVHISTANGLAPFDQTLHVGPDGSAAQSSPTNPFVALLNVATAVLAAAPADLQNESTWTIKVAAPSFSSGVTNRGSNYFSTVPVTMTVTSDSGGSLRLHGEGKDELGAQAPGSPPSTSETMTIDLELKSGSLQSCVQTTSQAVSASGAPGIELSQSISLTQR